MSFSLHYPLYFSRGNYLITNSNILWSNKSYAYRLINSTIIFIQLFIILLFVQYHLCNSFSTLIICYFTICPCLILTLRQIVSFFIIFLSVAVITACTILSLIHYSIQFFAIFILESMLFTITPLLIFIEIVSYIARVSL